jgi:hypothetical protein
MDFLGFLEEEKDFLEFPNNKKNSPLYGRPHGIPGSQLRPGLPVVCAAARPATGQPQPIRRQPVWRAAVQATVWPCFLVAGRTRSRGSVCGHAHVWARLCPGAPPPLATTGTPPQCSTECPRRRGRRRVGVSPAVMATDAWVAGLQDAPTRDSRVGARRPPGRPVRVVRVGRRRGRGGGAAARKGSSHAGAAARRKRWVRTEALAR